jgi:hypothetical protein
MMNLPIVLALFLASAVCAQDTCALRVAIRDGSGEPIDESVTLTMDDGRSLGTNQSQHGVAEFCDVSWGTFSVTMARRCAGK